MSDIQDAGIAGFFGVTKDRGSWKAQIKMPDGNIKNLGRFHSADAAAYVYDQEAKRIKSERINDIDMPVITSLLDAKQILGEERILSILNHHLHPNDK